MLGHELNQCLLHLFRMGCTQEVMATLDSNQVGFRGVLEQDDLMVRISNRINDIFSSLDKVS